MLKTFLSALSLCAVCNFVTVQSAVAQSKLKSLPSDATQETLRQLSPQGQSALSKRALIKLRVDPKNLQKSGSRVGAKDVQDVPFVVPNVMILQFKDGITKEQIDAFLQERDARVISVQENIGTVQIETDLTKFFKSRPTDNSINDVYIRGLSAAISEFKADSRVKNAAPDLMLRKHQTITNLLNPTARKSSAGAEEATDWGISDIQADELWSKPGARNGVIFGVMDVGFAQHEDIVFAPLIGGTAVDDHGNHVAGIACGKHNGLGVRGVIPNCFVRPRTGEFYEVEPGGDVIGFLQRFGQILAALNNFIPPKDEIKTYNISLGYNWIPNFGINPDETINESWRAIVAAQAEMFISVLELAQEKDKVIFSAAGNDSSGLSDPIDAKFASPMNFAAIEARERGVARNGVIVEAHDQNGSRAPFSNEKGTLSCPGVNILSAVAYDSSKNVVNNSYGEMSGTSMASPYCAAGHALLRLVRPNYSGVELLDCIIQASSSSRSTSGTPMMRLRAALQHCPAR